MSARKRDERDPSWLRRTSNQTLGTLRTLSLTNSPPSSPTTETKSMSDSSTENEGRSADAKGTKVSKPDPVARAVPSPKEIQRSSSLSRFTERLRIRTPSHSHHGQHENHAHHNRSGSSSERSSAHLLPARSHSQGPSPSPASPAPALVPVDPRLFQPLSPDSDPGFPDGAYYAADFMLGAGMVILQPATGKVVIVYDSNSKQYFLPKGRKDIGESLEQAALREAYEESGYRPEFLPLYVPTNAPVPAGERKFYLLPNTEPIYMSTYRWKGRRSLQGHGSIGGEYLTFWYVGQIPADAQWEADTGMPDEKGYSARLVDREAAMEALGGRETVDGLVVHKAYELLEFSQKHGPELERQRKMLPAQRMPAQRNSYAGQSSRPAQ